jgi:5-methylthioadenosine/S-adenosylhomocysteine deaminase
MHEHNVESVMCDGQWLMRDRELLTVDEAEVLALAKEHAQRIAERAGIRLPERFTVVDQTR